MNYNDGIVNIASQFKKLFAELSMRERWSRIKSMAKYVIACCVYTNLFTKNPFKYLKGNKDLENKIANFLDRVKENAEHRKDINFAHLDNKAVPLETHYINENKEGNGREVNGLSDRAE